ncbi:MAG: flagellar brake domain-containing protein [Synergistaceae bacterium]|jgi:c-di-GMP-binding flagellar brake protein YcgR|nr:flagellar brake domain-containing protein [Synergistaceae bacterium]
MSAEFEQTGKQLLELINSRVELMITSGLYKGSYVSRLEEVDENLLVGVAHPTVRGVFLPVMRNTELLLKIETSGCFYQATVSIVRNSRNVTIPLLWLKLVTSLEKVQRRMFVRVPCSIQAETCFLGYNAELPEETSLPDRQWFPVRIVDMSLGGCGISVKKNMQSWFLEGGRYILSLSVGGTSFFLTGKLVKIFKKNDVSVEAGLAYDGLTALIEKLMGAFIRQQEFQARG